MTGGIARQSDFRYPNFSWRDSVGEPAERIQQREFSRENSAERILLKIAQRFSAGFTGSDAKVPPGTKEALPSRTGLDPSAPFSQP